MKLKDNISVSKSGFVFDPNTGDSYSVNHTGSEIIKSLIDGKSDQLVINKLTNDHDISSHQLEGDFRDFVNHVKFLKLTKGE